MATSPYVIDVDEATFQSQVVERSHRTPVIVDFWADWCGPCKTLGPILEQAVTAQDGEVVLAKVDVDRNQQLAQAFRVQGIPAVKAFKDGRVVQEFTGAQPQQAVEAMIDAIVPSPNDRLAARARELAATDRDAAIAAAEQALAQDPAHRGAAIALAEIVLDDDPARALDLVTPHRPIEEAEAVASRAELALAGGDVDELAARVEADPSDDDAALQLARLRAADGDYERAVDLLLALVAKGGDIREPAREQLVAIFTVLGNDHELVRATRPRLAAALF
jgi:putative thioredoxin